jgi:hypothetical protein
MSKFIGFKKIKKTRKPHRCAACGENIKSGSVAWAWTSVDRGFFVSHVCEACGEDVQTHCFPCKQCDDGDGFPEHFIREAMNNDNDCEPCRRLRETGGE